MPGVHGISGNGPCQTMTDAGAANGPEARH